MPAIPHPYLVATGVVLFLIGIWCWRWSSRNAIDLKGAAIGAALKGAINRQIPDVPEDIKSKYDRITSETTNIGRAKTASSIGVRHVIAQAVWVASLVSLAVGACSIAAGFLWK